MATSYVLNGEEYWDLVDALEGASPSDMIESRFYRNGVCIEMYQVRSYEDVWLSLISSERLSSKMQFTTWLPNSVELYHGSLSFSQLLEKVFAKELEEATIMFNERIKGKKDKEVWECRPPWGYFF